MLSDKEVKVIMAGFSKELGPLASPLISPFNEERLGPVSYDLTTFIYERNRGVIKLETEEVLHLPRNIAGICSMRSRGEKLGLFWSGSLLVDPGYSGRLHFLVYCPDLPNKDFQCTNLFQIIFFKIGEVEESYDERKSSSNMGRKEVSEEHSKEVLSVPDSIIRKQSNSSLPLDRESSG